MWKPAPVPVASSWSEEVDPHSPLPEYPRPQLQRERWTNLNGLWDYAVVPESSPQPTQWQGEILVPFALESSLSGVGKRLAPGEALWYRRTFDVTAIEGRLLLHFGAVDWKCEVWVNGKSVGGHEGGFDPFTFDITDAARPGSNEIVLKVIDPTDDAAQPRGKQVREPHGIWYTPVSGIWQTVWLEPVPQVSIAALKITPDLDRNRVLVEITQRGGNAPAHARLQVLDGDNIVTDATGETGTQIAIDIRSPRTWSPDSPFLYGLKVALSGSRDAVTSYFGMRKVSVGRDAAGHQRILLNNKPLFMFGPLDQGWWPDGLYTAPTDEALRYDIEITRELGFNMARKHIKLEPARWYYWADRLGLLVWQDMPSGGIGARMDHYYIKPGAPEDAKVTDAEAAVFQREWKAILDAAHNHPSIVVWVPINEGWFQHRTNQIIEWTRTYDPTRLVDGPSGWEDRGVGDLHDMHRYPGPDMFVADGKRVSVLGEFGGLGLPLAGHTWQDSKNWGYVTYSGLDQLRAEYQTLIERLLPLPPRGLAAAVYTQTTDVEGEVNGALTYDRKVLKIRPEDVRSLHEAVIRAGQSPVRFTLLAATSQLRAAEHRFTTQAPPDDWANAGFDDSRWEAQQGPLGSHHRRHVHVPGAEWKTPEIWVRRRIELDSAPTGEVHFKIVHEQPCDLFVNGVHAASVEGAVSDYREVKLSDSARAALRQGTNVIGIHARGTGERRLVDVGLFAVSAVS